MDITTEETRYRFIEQQLAKRLIAQNSSGLFDSLTSLKGLVLDNRYELHSLYDVGGQSVVFLAGTDHGKQVVVKMALQPYHRPAYISTENIRQGRSRLEREGKLLKEFTGSLLPEFFDLIYAPNPLHPLARGNEIAESEPYLVMEFIDGETILNVSRQAHLKNPSDYRTIEWLSWETAVAVAGFLITVSDKSHGYLYSDVNPVNLMLVDRQERPVRILDAGSLVPFQPSPGLVAPFTPVFVQPDYYEAYREGRSLWPTVSSVMYSLGKVLWAILTNRHPHPGVDPDLTSGSLKHYSSRFLELLADLIKMRFETFEELQDAIEIANAGVERPSTTPLRFDSLADRSELGAQSRLIGKTSGSTKITEIARLAASGVSAVRYSPDGSYLAVATDRSVQLLNSKNLKPLGSFKSKQHSRIRTLEFDSSGEYLGSGSLGEICLWNIDRATLVWQYSDEHLNGRILLGRDGEFVVAVTKWNGLILAVKEASTPVRYYPGVAELCNCISWAGKELTLAVGGFGGVCVYRVLPSNELGALRPRPDYVLRRREIARFVALDDNARTLSVVTSRVDKSEACSLMVFRLPSLECLTHVALPSRSVSAVAWESNGKLAFIGDQEGFLAVWDQETGREHARLRVSEPIVSLDISPDGATLAASTTSGELHLYGLG